MLMKTAILLMNLITLTALLRLWRSYAPTRGRAEKPLRLSRVNRASTPTQSGGITMAYSKSQASTEPSSAVTSPSYSSQKSTWRLRGNSTVSAVGNPGRVPLPPRDEDALP